VYLNDICAGGGLGGIPRGAVKRLRLAGYHFSYRGMGGLLAPNEVFHACCFEWGVTV
jgi:hypothetical protein